jgi:hypothetical protein
LAAFLAPGISAGFAGAGSACDAALGRGAFSAGISGFRERPPGPAVSLVFFSTDGALAGVDFLVPATEAAAFLLTGLAEADCPALVFFSVAVSRGLGFPFPIGLLFTVLQSL